MKRQPTVWYLALLVSFILAACNGGSATPEAPTAAPTDQAAEPTGAPAEPTQAVEPPAPTTAPEPSGPPAIEQTGGQVNRDVTQAGLDAALTFGATTPGTPNTSWIAWTETASGGARQIFVSELVSGAFEGRGATLNIHSNVAADSPSIVFAGENFAVPWVTWAEPSPGFGNATQIFASRFNVASGLWQAAGQDRGGGEPSLNLNPDRPASHPFVFAGSGDPAKPPVPWVVWEEESGASNFVQIFVAKGVKDDAAIGGFRWEAVGETREDNEPTLNIDLKRDALVPSATFAESGNAVPWIAWHEISLDRPSRVFTARGVADANVPGGFKWAPVPACVPDETACALNVNPLKEAKDAWVTGGSLTPGEATVPWLSWAEIGPTGKWQVFVSKLDTSTRNSFVNVGGSLNVDQNHDARTPFVTFAGNVPYVAWLEDDGTGKFVIHLRHLASDPQTGTWVLDTPPGGFSLDASKGEFGLYATASPDSVFLAWTEGDPGATAAQILVASLKR